jgi:hypothetical protein
MSQLTHPAVSARQELRNHWILALSALLALAATIAVLLVLAIDGTPSDTSAAPDQSQAAQRSDRGPDDSAVGSKPGPARPIGGSLPASPGPSAPATEPGPARPMGGSLAPSHGPAALATEPGPARPIGLSTP